MKLLLKIFITLFISITSSFFIYSVIILNTTKTDLEEKLIQKIKNNNKLYTIPISALLYEFNEDVLISLLHSIYNDKEIVKIELIDFSNNLNLTLNKGEFNADDIIKDKLELKYANEKIGILKVSYTKKYINIFFNQFKNYAILFSVLLVFILLISLYFIIKQIIKSLDILSKATEKITSGNLHHKINIKSNDEIGLLANKFETMRENLHNREVLNKQQSEKIQELNKEMIETQEVLIETLGEVIEKRYIDDPYHVKRVADMSYLLAKLLGMKESEAISLKIVSPMHDIGKIGISDSILLKPGKLTPEEFEIMKTHSTIGYDILKDTHKETLDIASLVAYEHHERWNGTGYPMGKKGEEISIFGRITAIIDVFDALANKRCYKEAWQYDEIITYLKKERGEQFDPIIAQKLIDNIDIFIDVQKKYST